MRAPEIWTALFARNGMDAVCVLVQVTAAAARALRNFVALIVTIPHKIAALAPLPAPTERTRRRHTANLRHAAR